MIAVSKAVRVVQLADSATSSGSLVSARNVPNLDNFGGYMLIDGERGWVVQGSRFDLTAQDVIEFCERTATSFEKHG